MEKYYDLGSASMVIYTSGWFYFTDHYFDNCVFKLINLNEFKCHKVTSNCEMGAQTREKQLKVTSFLNVKYFF